MNAKRKCMVGHDDDYGWIIAIAIAIFVIAVVCAIIFYGGALSVVSTPSRIIFLHLSTMLLTVTVNRFPLHKGELA